MNLNLNDIKPIVQIDDYSFVVLVTTLIVGAFIALWLFRFGLYYSKNNCKIDCDRYYFKKYCEADWSNPKEAAYIATKYGAVLAQDKRRKELFNQLRAKLDRYKYKTKIDEVDKETLNYYNLYKQVCDESL